MERWNSRAMPRALPMTLPTVRKSFGRSFGPTTISATMPISSSSIQPMSNMAFRLTGRSRP
jgi:hypothetical protein